VTIIDWNGSDLPDARQQLPAGRYVAERLDELPTLPEEDDGLRQALDSLRAGRGLDHDAVRRSEIARRIS
jgi:hypothetical protein